MNLSAHFTLAEATFSSTATRLGLDNTPSDIQLASMGIAALGMEHVRDLLGGRAIHVDSWLRTEAVNKAVGGVKSSAHVLGYAIDFICPDFGTPLDIVRAIQKSGLKCDQCIQEGSWVHISFDLKLRQQFLTAHFVAGQPTTYTNGITA
jgi:hypothetical protein